MASGEPIRARCDAAGHLTMAEEAIARLQVAAGGAVPGLLAIPALLALVRQVAATGLAQVRPVVAMDGDCAIAFRAEAMPEADGIALALHDWRRAAAPDEGLPPASPQDLWYHLAEGHVLLDARQNVIAADLAAADLADLASDLSGAIGRHWTACSALSLEAGLIDAARLHWRLLDDMVVDVIGSPRRWRVRIVPRVASGFDLLLLPETILALPAGWQASVAPHETGGEEALPPWTSFLGRDLAPVLRQPISRIIANAETIRSRLAGPLADAYGNYAADIAEAGRHLLGLVEDLADLDAVEAPGFAPAPDHIDLADCARRAAGILSVRARERGIVLAVPEDDCQAPAVGEFRRVLQVLLNLLSNAIRYTPAQATVTLSCGVDGAMAWVAVADHGEGLTANQAARVFEKFERLGRSGDGGSGLGLYISRRLARAMAGDLTVASTPGQGARFVLTLPADVPSAGIVNAR
jgi:signal transduction histidine kinase